MKVPIKCGLDQKLDMVGRRDTSKGFHGLLEKLSAVLVQRVIVVKESRGQVKGPVLELLGNPIVGLGVLTLETHVLCMGSSVKVMVRAVIARSSETPQQDSTPCLTRSSFSKGKNRER